VIALLVTRTAMPHWKRILCYRLTRVMAVLGFVESCFLFFIQLLDLKAFCTWCLGSALAATAIFILSWFDGHPEVDSSKETKELQFQFTMIALTLILGAILILALTIPRSNGTPPTIAPVSSEAESAALSILNRSDISFEGPKDAKVTLIEFADFQCPACRQAYPEVQKVLKKYEGKIRFAYREFPLPIHEYAKGAAVAAVCADHQGKLYPYADVMFTGDAKLTRDDLVHDAADLRLDMNVFMSCLEATSTREAVARDVTDGDTLGVTQTPTFFVNGVMIDGLPNADQLGTIIDQALASAGG
jgi:protein-disulfide isomerase